MAVCSIGCDRRNLLLLTLFLVSMLDPFVLIATLPIIMIATLILLTFILILRCRQPLIRINIFLLHTFTNIFTLLLAFGILFLLFRVLYKIIIILFRHGFLLLCIFLILFLIFRGFRFFSLVAFFLSFGLLRSFFGVFLNFNDFWLDALGCDRRGLLLLFLLVCSSEERCHHVVSRGGRLFVYLGLLWLLVIFSWFLFKVLRVYLRPHA